MKEALRMERRSLKRLSGKGLEGAPLHGALEDMLRKDPDTGISHHRDTFKGEGDLESGRGLVYRGL